MTIKLSTTNSVNETLQHKALWGLDVGGQSRLQLRGRLRGGSELLSRIFWIDTLGVESTSSVRSCKLFDLEVQKRDKVKEMLLLGPSCGEKGRKAGEKIYRN